MRPARRREHVRRVVAQYGISERKACRALRWPRSSHRYRSQAKDTTALRQHLRELALARPRYGYRRLHILLRREGWRVNHKKLLRLYREEGLALRIRRRKRKVASVVRVPPRKPTRPNEQWAIDFLSDALVSGRRFRVLTVIDVYSREALAVSARISFPASEVTAVLDRIGFRRSLPKLITLDNGTEFTGKHFDAWAYRHGVKLDFIRPGKPVENCFVESFNGRVRDECLSVHWFETLDEAKSILEDWRRDFNQTRPHSSLSDQVPEAYVESLLQFTPVAPKQAAR